MWSEPHRIAEQLLNSYKLETLDGKLLVGEYHTRRLREFIPREGTKLAEQQKELETRREEMEGEFRGEEPVHLGDAREGESNIIPDSEEPENNSTA